MPSFFTILATAWEFHRTQPVFNQVFVWLLFLPSVLLMLVNRMLTDVDVPSAFLMMTLINLGFSIWMLWGMGCVLVIGKKLLKSKAGRSRSSFFTVRKQGAKLVVPLFLTDLLRDCITAILLVPAIGLGLLAQQTSILQDVPSHLVTLGMLALAIPGIVYWAQTSFYLVIIANEKKEYMPAIRKSQAVVQGRTMLVIWILLAISIILTLPILGVATAVVDMAEIIDQNIVYAADVLIGSFIASAIMLYGLCSIVLYDSLKKLPSPTTA